MFKVSNQKVLRLLSQRSLRASRMRNCIAIVAIALTTVLFTSFFTIGGSMIDTTEQLTMRQVGTSAHAGFKYLTGAQYEKVAADPKLKDISYNIIVGFAENEALKKVYTEIRWTEEKAAQWSFTQPTTGHLPEAYDELATSTAVLDALGIPHQIGEKVPLEFTSNGVFYQEVFILSGFWEQDPASMANEAYVSRAFCDEVAPVLAVPYYEVPPVDNSYAGTVNPTFWFYSSWNLDQQVADLMERCDFDPSLVNSGVNWAYSAATIDVMTILLIVVVVLVILLSGYLIIYNIFLISVTKEIHFYGLLKTIGTTGKQLKKIVRRQALLLAVVGIPIGLLLGWLCGQWLAPVAMSVTSYAAEYSASTNPFVFLCAMIFTLITIWLSCIRPCRLAAAVSPVEAIHYTDAECSRKGHQKRKTSKVTPWSMAWANMGRSRRKTILVVLSLSLSMILLNSVYTVVTGFDMDRYLENRAVSDFLMTDASIKNIAAPVKNYEGITPQIQQDIAALSGITNMGRLYMHEYQYAPGAQEVARLVETARNIEAEIELSRDFEMLVTQTEASGVMASHIYGINEYAVSKFKQAQIDWQRFSSGEYVLVSSIFSDSETSFYLPGDSITLDFGNGQQKTYEVLAVTSPPFSIGPQHGHLFDIYFTLPETEYLQQFPAGQPLSLFFDVEPSLLEATESWIIDYCKYNPDLAYESKAVFEAEFAGLQNTYLLVGGTLSGILALIGILNYVNTILTSIITRRKELSMLQAVGMTGKQLQSMLIKEGLCYAGLTLFFTLAAGLPLSYFLVQIIAGQMWFFQWHLTLLPIFLCLPVLLFVTFIVPVLAYQQFSRQSLIERLRMTE